MEIHITVLQEAIYSRIAKAKAITNCMLSLSDAHTLKPQVIHDAIWAVEDYLEDLLHLCDKLTAMMN